MRFVKYGLVTALVIVSAVGGGFWWVARGFGAAGMDWSKFVGAKVTLDGIGVPTIEAGSWEALVEAQGYVTAADRMFQMDILRRAAAGRLSEWMGEVTVNYDRRRRLEDWEGVAKAGEEDLPRDERRFCDLYAQGVNRFLVENEGHVSLEHRLLRKKPEPWRCRDSLLILLAMSEDLTASFEDEPARAVWSGFLKGGWERFLYPQVHPWNQLLFGTSTDEPFLPAADALPMKPLSDTEKQIPLQAESELSILGSNSWVYRQPDTLVLANDPHLGLTVPNLWYAVRLRISASDWVVGNSLPGMPGVVLGMNEKVAWAFTNLLEDVDDLLLEELSEDGKSYVARVEADGSKTYQPIEERHFVLSVAGGKDREVVARFTHRGPLQNYVPNSKSFYSRQWVPFKPGRLRLPNLSLNRVQNWDSFNAAVDGFTTPAQNILYADREGNIGYRSSGSGVVRRPVSGFIPQPALKGEWIGFEDPAKRPRLYEPAGTARASMVTANQRIFPDKAAYWTGDMRAERIQRALAASAALKAKDMEKLQRDTESRINREILQWVAEKATPKSPEEQRLVTQWKEWDGVAEQHPDVFAQSEVVRRAFRDLLIDRVRQAYIPASAPRPVYKWRMESAWTLRTLHTPNGTNAFGVEGAELANYLLARIARHAKVYEAGYADTNRWKAQHPFSRLPAIGWVFTIPEHPQVGFRDLVRSERPTHGAGTRLVYDLKHLENSSWVTPVGQSGHIMSPHFQDQRSAWFSGKTYPMLDSKFEWK
jgi:penicillin amidase